MAHSLHIESRNPTPLEGSIIIFIFSSGAVLALLSKLVSAFVIVSKSIFTTMMITYLLPDT